MNQDEKCILIDRYLTAYNGFDIDGMLAVLHPEIEFTNVSGGRANATASGTEEFRHLAEQSKHLFLSRKQTATKFWTNEDQAFIEVTFEGILAADLPNGIKGGETLRLTGRSEFTFRDGKIYRITDIS